MLEVENTLTWGFDPRRRKYVFPLHNLSYEPEQRTVETKRERAREPDVQFPHGAAPLPLPARYGAGGRRLRSSRLDDF